MVVKFTVSYEQGGPPAKSLGGWISVRLSIINKNIIQNMKIMCLTFNTMNGIDSK